MKIHFIAIAGAVMHNLAIALHKKGYQVTGSDDAIYEPALSKLKKYGLLPKNMGWSSENITDDIDVVIVGMHAKKDNPELLAAQKKGLKIGSYPDFIYQQSQNKTRVVIGGSHGKTTITAMVLHVLHYCNKQVDYLVGAQLEGFETMVHLTDSNEFMVMEGDEYLASPLDLRPKFHLYKPNIALISGIAWDHINVFPTFEKYVAQFKIFIESITPGGILMYNSEDTLLKEIVAADTTPIKKYAYQTPQHTIRDGQTFLHTSEGALPLEIFGQHNLQNIAGAKWICQHMGIGEEDFYAGIMSFKGANKRLEKITDKPHTKIFRDFAHAPSKVKATTDSAKKQYPSFRLVVCLELHTYSSLNLNFLSQYKDSLRAADSAVIFYNPQTILQKQQAPIVPSYIKTCFNRADLKIFTDVQQLENFLFGVSLHKSVLLLMSSGNYAGFCVEKFFEN